MTRGRGKFSRNDAVVSNPVPIANSKNRHRQSSPNQDLETQSLQLPVDVPHPWDLFKHIVRRTKERSLDPHPMVVILRPSEQFQVPQHPGVTFLLGYIQLCWLCALSFLFGSTVAGTLYLTLKFVITFVSTVAAARALSIFLCWWLEKALDVLVIEYETAEEQIAAKTAICSAGMVVIPDEPEQRQILVESKTGFYRYCKGYRLTSVPCPHFENGTCREVQPRQTTTTEKDKQQPEMSTLVGGRLAFEILCVIFALISIIVLVALIPWHFLPYLWTPVVFIVACSLGYTVWKEAHASEDYKIWPKRLKEQKGRNIGASGN